MCFCHDDANNKMTHPKMKYKIIENDRQMLKSSDYKDSKNALLVSFGVVDVGFGKTCLTLSYLVVTSSLDKVVIPQE